jgi:hypothetical protein
MSVGVLGGPPFEYSGCRAKRVRCIPAAGSSVKFRITNSSTLTFYSIFINTKSLVYEKIITLCGTGENRTPLGLFLDTPFCRVLVRFLRTKHLTHFCLLTYDINTPFVPPHY